VISFFDDLNVVRVYPVKIHQFDPEEKSFININTPEEYQRSIGIVDD